jgi:hypothetical protein
MISFALVVWARLSSEAEDASLALRLVESEADGEMPRIALLRILVFNCM